MRPSVVANGVLVAGGAAMLGAIGAIGLAVRLPPAEAMRPEPPARYRPTMLERIGLGSAGAQCGPDGAPPARAPSDQDDHSR